jgi:HEAT repeat protein
LGKKLDSSDAEERREAAVDLGREGSGAMDLLFRAMGDIDWRVRKTAVEALVAIGGAHVIHGLIQALNADDNAGARNSAIEALVQIGVPSVDPLLEIVETPDPDVRKFVVDILGDIKDPRAVPALIDGWETLMKAASRPPKPRQIRDPAPSPCLPVYPP